MSNGGEATFGREKVESSPFESWFERDGLATATRRERERIAVKGIRNKEGERERGKGENKGEEWWYAWCLSRNREKERGRR